jgi:hypothetical protein
MSAIKWIQAFVLLCYTIIMFMAEKMLFGCTRKEGKEIHIESISNKVWKNFFGGSFIIGGGIIVLTATSTLLAAGPNKPLGLPSFVWGILALVGLLTVLIGAWLVGFDSHFDTGYMVFKNKSKNNWNFIRVVGMMNLIIVLLLDMQMVSLMCGSSEQSLGGRAHGAIRNKYEFRSPIQQKNRDNYPIY